MTGHPTHHTRWETTAITDAVIGVLTGILDHRTPPPRDICPHCRALIAAATPCPICTEIRRRTHNGAAA